MPKTSDSARQRRHDRGLTLPQQNAVDLLAAGKTDTEAAAAVGVARETVTRWRCYDPVFGAALNRLRAAIWQHGTDRLRSLYPKALEALGAVLDDPEHPARWKAAIELLKLVQPTAELVPGPQDADGVVKNVVEFRRATTRTFLDDTRDAPGLPPFERHMEQTWRELEGQAGVNGKPDAETPRG